MGSKDDMLHISSTPSAISTQEVPSHRSFVVLFKYFGGGEVDFVQHLPSTPEKLAAEGQFWLAVFRCNALLEYFASALQ